MAILTLLVALSISIVAAIFSIAGLAAIFAAAKIPIIVMGSVLEVGKLVTAVWLHRYWKEAPILLRSYLTVAVIVLMFITSMGIFGYLSKAHIDQTIGTSDNSVFITQIDNKIGRQQKRIDTSEEVISQLDQAVQTLISYDRIRGPEGSIAVRESQKPERAQLNSIVDSASDTIAELQTERSALSREQIILEAEVGPIKYIAELIYGDAEPALLEKAVRWMILMIIFVFDPLAILMIIAANMTLMENRKKVVTQKVTVVEDNKNWNSFFEADRTFDVEEPFVEPIREQSAPVDIGPEATSIDTPWPIKEDTNIEEWGDIIIPQGKSLDDMLADVDKKLKEYYNSESTEHKEEKRELERLRAKIVMRIDAKRG
tara:strand:- start:6865 stop:7980 length:1116 start_codon:yes stop_codon:yes gene_type:complete